MATLEDVYAKLVSDDGEKKALAQAFADKQVGEFLTERGCEATEDEFTAFLKDKVAPSGDAISEEELAAVGGGTWRDWVLSFCGLGVCCAGMAAASALGKAYDPNNEYYAYYGKFDMCTQMS